MNKKNLDKIFREKFKNFSEVPENKVWEGIVTALDEKNKRRGVVPFWWKLGGIAAALAIALYVINPFPDTANENQVITEVEKQSDTEALQKNDEQKNKLDNQNIVEDAIVVGETNQKIETSNDPAKQPLNSRLQNGKNKKPDPSINHNNPKNSEVAEYDAEKNILKKDLNEETIDDKRISQSQKEAVAISEKEVDQNNQVKKMGVTAQSNPKTIAKDNGNKTQEEGIALLEKELSEDASEASKKKSIFDEIKAQEKADEVMIAANDGSKWAVGANVAPVYFSSIGEGSPIHSSFVPNSKSGDINLSYGLSVAYSISKKLSVRSGIHKVDYGYNTNDVEFSSTFEASALGQIQNIDYTVSSENVFVSSKTSANALRENAAFDAANQEASRDGVITQQFGYLEIPVELNYALIDRRFGVNLVGGLSSLFLVDNSVELSSGQLNTEIGKANNINSVNFSANAGFGVNYKFSPKVQLNIEPVFKYQLNTFSNDSGNFQPFSIGVYSGLNFRF